MLSQPVPPGSADQAEPLTERELEVLALVVEGASNQEIARSLVVSLATVKTTSTTSFASSVRRVAFRS
jgi:ATP/maltotriose-dependent transcriptional regulator MalT